ncbi:kinase-like domain-containing protein, partial [Globomyces pollinis-pini]
GGYSFVYLVMDQFDRKQYALKQIKIQLEEQSNLIKSEIHAHKQVNSPYILKLIDSQLIMSNGKPSQGLLLLPYYENGTIQNLIEKSPHGLPMSQIAAFGIDICRGLAAFQYFLFLNPSSCNPPLAYRDLKPANILISDENTGVLMDLGSVSVARVKLNSRRESIALQEYCAETVTAPFRPPELFDPPSEGEVTEATDIWSLGCTLYAMAYGQSPFDGSMTAAVSCSISFPPQDNYSPHFRTLIQAILVSKPSSRPTLLQIETILGKLASSNNFQNNNV